MVRNKELKKKSQLLHCTTRYKTTAGGGRTKVNLLAYNLGDNHVVFIYNENAHIGAVSIGEYDDKEERVSTSVVTRLGHKDDAVAQKAAALLTKSTKQASCVIAGIHVDNITKVEIDQILENCNHLMNEFVSLLGTCSKGD